MSTHPPARFLDRTTPPHIITLVLLAGVSAMNMSVFLPSLPSISEDLNAEYGVVQLSVSAYLACTAVLQVLIGPISDKLGRRPVMIVALGVFVLASLGCYFAQTIEVFLFFRMLQAVVAVGMVLSRAIVRDMFPQNEAASMIGYVTMGMSLVPMIAPSIGGALDTLFGWRATFLFLVFVGLGLMWLAWRDQGETNSTAGMSFREQVIEYPELFRSPRFWGYAWAAAFSSGTFFAFLGGAPYVATEVYNQPVAMTGFFLGMPAIGYAFGNFLSGRFSVRKGINWMIMAGCILQMLGLGASLAVGYAGFSGAWLFFGFVTFVGLGNGLVLPNANAGLLSVRPHLAGTASGIGGAIMIGGGAVLAAYAGAMLEGGNGAFPLKWIMFLSSVAAFGCILYVLYRTRAIQES